MAKQCLVTGGAGFIGSHLVDALLHHGAGVRVLDDFSTGNLANLAQVQGRFDLIRGSVVDQSIVDQAVAGCDVVFHLAAIASVVKSVEEPLVSHDVTATGTLRVLDAARRLGAKRVVFAGSASAYGDQPGTERREGDLLMPLSPYAAAKLAGEHYCEAFTSVYGLETVRLRFFNVFGPRQDPKSPYSGVIALFIDAMTKGKTPTIFGDGLQARDFVYVANVVQALMLAGALLPSPLGGEGPGVRGSPVYNIGSGGSTTILDLVKHLNDLLGTKIVPIHQPSRAGDVRLSQACIKRAQTELGYEPKVGFREGLAKTIRGA